MLETFCWPLAKMLILSQYAQLFVLGDSGYYSDPHSVGIDMINRDS